MSGGVLRVADGAVETAHHRAAPQQLRAVDLDRARGESCEPAQEQDQPERLGVVDQGQAGLLDDVGQEEPQRPVGEAQGLQTVHAGAVDGVEVGRERARHVEELEGDQHVEGGGRPEQRAGPGVRGSGLGSMGGRRWRTVLRHRTQLLMGPSWGS